MRKASSPSSPPKGRVLIIDDEKAMGSILVKSLELDGYEAVAYTDPREAIEKIAETQPDVVLTDIRMPGMTGHQVLERLRADSPEIPVLIMTAYGTIEDAVATLKAGAFNYVTKPFQHESLLHQIELALQHRQLEQENIKLSDQDIPQLTARQIIGSSAGLERVREMIQRAAMTDSSVLITGESGVGKELVAREVHRRSARKDKRFVVINCPAIPASLIESEMFGYERGAFTGADHPKIGLIELSAGGTVFLDEIGEMPVELQAKFLRVIQEHEIQRVGGIRQVAVDLRVVAATNRLLQQEIEEGRFRLDLFYRLNVITIEVPPLRERPEDIPELAEFFLEKIGRRLNRKELELSDEVLELFSTLAWPGNIRQLENALERMAILSNSEALGLDSLPSDLTREERGAEEASSDRGSAPQEPTTWPKNFKDAREQFERSYLRQLLRETEGNVTNASRLSGISRRSLYEKLEKLGVDKDSIAD